MRLNKINTSVITAVFFALVVFSDFHYKLLSYDYLNTIKFTLIIKLIIGVVFGAIVVNTLQKKTVLLTLLLILCGSISVLVLRTDFYILCQYNFGIIILLFFLNSKPQLEKKYLLRVVETVIGLNFVCILLGIFFGIDFFQTYQGGRFGYNGIFKSTSTASFFYMFSIMFLLLKKKKSKFNITLLIIAFISSLFIGSKTLYAYVIFCLVIIMLEFIGKRKGVIGVKMFYLLPFMICIVICTIVFIPLVSLNETLHRLLVEEGVLTTFFSNRDHHVINAYKDMKESYNTMNFLFGGLAKVKRLTEMALIDLFLVFGLVGSIIYNVLLISIFPRIQDISLRIMLAFVLVIIFLRGDFLYFPSVMFISMAIFTIVLNEINFKAKNI